MDIAASNWNEDDNANITAAPDGAPEGMAPGGVNNVLRTMMGAVKRWFNWSAPKLTAGSGTAYTVSYSMAPGAYVDGISFLVELHAAPGVGATLNVGGLGAIPLRHFYNGTWYPLPPSWCASGSVLRAIYHAASGVFRIADSVQAIPTGTSQANRSSTTPAGWLAEDGSPVSRTQYAALFAAIGTAYGVGDGSTTFNLPDSRGYVDAGIGGALAGSLAQKVGGITNTAPILNISVAGTASGTLTGGASPSGAETAAAASGSGASHVAHDHAVSVSGSLSVSGLATGTSLAFNIVQPTMIVNKMIRI
jgi:microcystin-dependent protein